MLQATALRMAKLDAVVGPMVVCGRDQTAEIMEQLAAIGCPPSMTIAEPAGRNTAPAIAAAALVAPRDAVLAILPADHLVADQPAFEAAMQSAVAAAGDGHIVTFGVVPTRAESGYGYIEATGEGAVRSIAGFVEKPAAEVAARLFDEGRHFWNSGMFVARPDVLLTELRRHAPSIVEAVERSLVGTAGPIVHPGRDFENALSLPFDVAVMEQTDRAVMVVLDAGWSDVGSWRSLWEIGERDHDENVLVGDVIASDTHRSYIRSHARPVVVLGLDDVTVVDAGDVVFVASMRHAQDVRALVEWVDRERPGLG